MANRGNDAAMGHVRVAASAPTAEGSCVASAMCASVPSGIRGVATGMRVALGYSFTNHFAVEAAYTDFGELSESALGSNLSAQADAFELALLGRLPLSERIALFTRLGYAWLDGETSVVTATTGISGNDVSYGAGLEFAIGESLSVALSGTKYRLDELDVAVLGIGIKFRF